MATQYVRKLLFSIFIDSADGPPKDLNTLAEEDFPSTADPKALAALKFSADPRVEQIGFYYSRDNSKGVFVGVADGQELIEITADGKPRLAGMDAENHESKEVINFVASIVRQAGLGETKSTWVVVPLDELGSGFGALHLGGMGGISGGFISGF